MAFTSLEAFTEQWKKKASSMQLFGIAGRQFESLEADSLNPIEQEPQ